MTFWKLAISRNYRWAKIYKTLHVQKQINEKLFFSIEKNTEMIDKQTILSQKNNYSIHSNHIHRIFAEADF